MATEVSPQGVEGFDDALYEEQCQISSMWTSSRLLVVLSLFLYGAFTFTYFYLRALDNNNDWRVGNQHASTLIGVMVTACLIGSALLHYMSARRLQVGMKFDYLVGAGLSLGLVATACGLQIWQLTRLPFQPASSGYTSVFIAWMPIYIVYMLGQIYWLETILAQAIVRPWSAFRPTTDPDLPPVVPRFGANVEGYILFSEFMGAMALLIMILFYAIP